MDIKYKLVKNKKHGIICDECCHFLRSGVNMGKDNHSNCGADFFCNTSVRFMGYHWEFE